PCFALGAERSTFLATLKACARVILPVFPKVLIVLVAIVAFLRPRFSNMGGKLPQQPRSGTPCLRSYILPHQPNASTLKGGAAKPEPSAFPLNRNGGPVPCSEKLDGFFELTGHKLV